MTTPEVRIIVEVVPGTPAVTVENPENTDHLREQIIKWTTEARVQRERADKFEAWLRRIVSTDYPATHRAVVRAEMREDGLL